ncbi:hypothetical protein PFISCL1PPCAC_15313, partial [Pristionchus fissidentatus]
SFRFIFDISNVKMLREYARNVQLAQYSVPSPFGRISKEDLEKAREVLDKLARNLEEMDEFREKNPPNMKEVFRLTDEQYSLSSSFYSLLPIGGYERSSIPVITESNRLTEARSLLTTLGDIEIAGRLISAAVYSEKKRGLDPIKYIMEAIDCSISLIPPKETLAQRVLQWIANSNEGVKIDSIYSINSRRAAEAMKKHAKCENAM